MQVHTLKQDAIESIQRLPEDADIEEIMYRLYVVEKLRKSRDAIAQGETTGHDALKQELDRW